ncbi:metallophosphoesterase [Cryobacterium sp. CG_9.6]|uniref:metallophosphoesterase family protein n=1 Tax=Cryobacterium sp. CG_9.6 TaxID=2760710 RepID=UPI0024731509|nr:metallophosphoesterase [Cryobacterium sp. CG_9.6]MDH6236329.1 3',5'-cyclic AMP phosphodiesterase CpdA [Cryobacterium sp. CG_9.6]
MTTERHTILHISDIHATDGELLYGQVDGIGRLYRVAQYVAEAGLTPEAIVITGDLAQSGHGNAYPRLRNAFAEVSSLLGAPLFSTLGNHDEPAQARVLDGHAIQHYRVIELDRLRIVTLDTSTGSIPSDQLDWLRAVLAVPYGWGTVLAMHHAPVPSPLPALARRGLGNSAELAAAIKNSDVRLILAGHYHHTMSAEIAGIPVWVGPSLAYEQIMNAGPHEVAGQDSAMFSIIQLTETGFSAAPVSLLSSTPLFTIPIGQATVAGRLPSTH